MDTISRHFWIAPEDIALAQGLLAGFEGLACLRVARRNTGEVTFWIPPGREDDFDVFVTDLAHWVEIRERTV